jgi:hypothetical protein
MTDAEFRLSHLSKVERFYLGIREYVSLLLSEGHPSARRYPLGTLYYEAQLVRERINRKMITESVLMQAVINAVLSPSGDGHKSLNKLFKDLRNGH